LYNICIKISNTDNASDIAVLMVIPSLKNIPTNTAYTTIPIPKPMNRDGHKTPSMDSTVYLVAQI
jgi:hypothetical protein